MADAAQQFRWYGPIPTAHINRYTDPARTFGILVAKLGTIGFVRKCGCQDRGSGGQSYLAPCSVHETYEFTRLFKQTRLPAYLSDSFSH